ncbi:hypothetical protein STSP2_01601 [Anaerohalosphaera lusitana]|uniref:Uncharacterized protein n=1 Tax=Anaerohalosphaera lusitana TaxID=1936003 RepID=A0A1U9NKV8_9BACT|nr:hypothetical protein STSP2_01601 [Anaerohalosphaera lusitana]
MLAFFIHHEGHEGARRRYRGKKNMESLRDGFFMLGPPAADDKEGVWFNRKEDEEGNRGRTDKNMESLRDGFFMLDPGSGSGMTTAKICVLFCKGLGC